MGVAEQRARPRCLPRGAQRLPPPCDLPWIWGPNFTRLPPHNRRGGRRRQLGAGGRLEVRTRWSSAPMRRGNRVAYLAQDGCRLIPTGPKALFIGGSTEEQVGP